MIATMEDVLVRTRADFDCLPEEGLWEVVDGRAILLPANKVPHQRISGAMYLAFSRGLEKLGYGYVFATVNVLIPSPDPRTSEVQNRVPDLVVARHAPAENFEAGDPPELVIEILSSRRRNVERTEKIEDYARAGIEEYWIVNPLDRTVEVYVLREGQYVVRETVSEGPLQPGFPGA